MQKHNKYLVITIWIATIAFIGAGFVGWGSYQYGAKAGSIAKVGDIEINKARFDMAYSDLYQRYNQMMQGKLDEKKAREMGLAQQAFSSLAAQALLLNLANEFGIVVSEKELGEKLAAIPAFQTEGKFDKSVYDGYLKSRRLKAKTFEQVLHDELVVNKMLSLLDSKALPFETEVVSAAINVSDKVAYKVLSTNDLNLTVTDEDLKKYWEEHKSSYMTPKKFQLDILWTESKDANTTEKELEAFYSQNSYNYIDDSGKQLSLDESREKVLNDLKMKKSKKHAQKEYIAYKKGKIDKSETVTLVLNDALLTAEVWKEIESRDVNDILKPKAVGNRYVTVKIAAILEPQTMSYEEAKAVVAADYKKSAKAEKLSALADSTLKNFDESQAVVSDFVTLQHKESLKSLNTQETFQFLQKLFTTQQEKGIISIEDKVVVYKVLEQRLSPVATEEESKMIENLVNKIKREDFQSNLLKNLGQRYSIEKYVEGI